MVEKERCGKYTQYCGDDQDLVASAGCKDQRVRDQAIAGAGKGGHDPDRERIRINRTSCGVSTGISLDLTVARDRV